MPNNRARGAEPAGERPVSVLPESVSVSPMVVKLGAVPGKPGVYIFRDSKGGILYVGKAKALKNRLRSYFQKSSALDERKTAMMRLVADFEFTVTGNELEALILEATLIKQHKPRYNILLRDDKSYPYLKLTLNEQWPRLEVVRRIQRRDGARYFGPYVPAGAMWKTLSFIRNHYRIPNCRYSLDRRMRPCIQHQIGKCVAPCSGEVDHAGYMRMIREVELLLEGKNRRLLADLEAKMARLSGELRYEEAAVIRDRIQAIRSISEAQKMVSPTIGDMDLFGLFRDGGIAVCKLLFVRNGVLIGTREFVLRHTAGETDADLLRNVISQFYVRDVLPPPEVCCSVLPESAAVLADWLSGKREARVRIAAPKRGQKRKLLDMAEENAQEIIRSISPQESHAGAAEGIAHLVGMAEPPESIGAFDISNISGTSAVGAFVWWERGEFVASRYRHIRMDAVRGPDDYAMMREMVRRTVRSLGQGQTAKGEEEGEQADGGLPDLVIIDGGREHLRAAREVFAELSLFPRMAVGLAKDPDRIFLPDREEPLVIDDSRPASLLLRRIRDEVHRFAIRYHRKLREKKSFESVLDHIYGLGRQRRLALIEHFGSIEAVRSASAAEIAGIKGFTKKLAESVVEALKSSGNEQEENS